MLIVRFAIIRLVESAVLGSISIQPTKYAIHVLVVPISMLPFPLELVPFVLSIIVSLFVPNVQALTTVQTTSALPVRPPYPTAAHVPPSPTALPVYPVISSQAHPANPALSPTKTVYTATAINAQIAKSATIPLITSTV